MDNYIEKGAKVSQAAKKQMKNPSGNCYEHAAKYMLEHRNEKDLKMVHGMVSGQGDVKGVRFGHAWNEKGDTVIDASRPDRGEPIKMQKAAYYAIGKIKEGEVKRYSHEETLHNLMEHMHYGPWDEKKSR